MSGIMHFNCCPPYILSSGFCLSYASGMEMTIPLLFCPFSNFCILCPSSFWIRPVPFLSVARNFFFFSKSSCLKMVTVTRFDQQLQKQVVLFISCCISYCEALHSSSMSAPLRRSHYINSLQLEGFFIAIRAVCLPLKHSSALVDNIQGKLSFFQTLIGFGRLSLKGEGCGVLFLWYALSINVLKSRTAFGLLWNLYFRIVRYSCN